MHPELEASLRILAHVARADGRVCGEERLAIDALAARAGTISTSQLVHDDTDLNSLLRAVVSPDLRRRTVVWADAVAYVDGKCPPEELAALQSIHRALAGEFAIDQVGDAALKRHTERICKAFEDATVAYLHEVHAAATHHDLSMGRYLHLVAGLEATKREIQHAFLSAVDAADAQVARRR